MSYLRKILRRALIVLPALALQFLWLRLLMKLLAPWAVAITTVLSILASLLVLFLITKQDESTYKILWLLLILTFPIPGTLLYLLIGNKRTTKPLKKLLSQVTPLPLLPDEASRQVYKALEQDSVRMAQCFRSLSRITGFTPYINEKSQYYPLGDDLFPAMLEAMEQAEHFIFAEYFIIEPGKMWDAMIAVMERKAAEGVVVRILYDDFGSIATYPSGDIIALRKKKIHCVPFNPLLFVKGSLNYRDHRKMLIVDGKIAFSGGINLADEYINHKKLYGHWKDIGFRITGSAAAAYTRMFAEFWEAFAREKLPEALLESCPPQSASGDSDGYVLSYYDSPLRDEAASNELYIDLLSQAEKSAWFITPYLMPGEALLDAFLRAARRGVDVRIIMPGIPDKKIIFRMSRSFYAPLLQAGVKIYEYVPGFVHAKGCLIDGVAATIGTVNLDYRSLFLHFENNALFYKAGIIREFEEDYRQTLESCREIKPQLSGRFRLLHWTIDGILRIFAPLC